MYLSFYICIVSSLMIVHLSQNTHSTLVCFLKSCTLISFTGMKGIFMYFIVFWLVCGKMANSRSIHWKSKAHTSKLKERLSVTEICSFLFFLFKVDSHGIGPLLKTCKRFLIVGICRPGSKAWKKLFSQLRISGDITSLGMHWKSSDLHKRWWNNENMLDSGHSVPAI